MTREEAKTLQRGDRVHIARSRYNSHVVLSVSESGDLVYVWPEGSQRSDHIRAYSIGRVSR
jgi:hypothetical protein